MDDELIDKMLGVGRQPPKKQIFLEDLKVSEDVFDRSTLLTLYDLVNRGYISVLHGAVKTGKESSVFLSMDGSGERHAVKIHRIVTSDFRQMSRYIEGDRRFKDIKRSKRSMIFTWVEKEFMNLRTAFDAGVSVPRPVVRRGNVLVMEFIGEGDVAAPMLRDVKLRTEGFYREVVEEVKRLYESGLVHGDLSEYNILVHRGKPVLIDISQGVPVSHPMAEELLRRDVGNVARFFGKKFDKVWATIVG
ncbi:MAG: serine protein kinase RIO [Methanobacteriota archaeon]|nr:MAG: serine protein kinase RIO [Euryarchaeota archaeon]